jgi:hypothetical protein
MSNTNSNKVRARIRHSLNTANSSNLPPQVNLSMGQDCQSSSHLQSGIVCPSAARRTQQTHRPILALLPRCSHFKAPTMSRGHTCRLLLQLLPRVLCGRPCLSSCCWLCTTRACCHPPHPTPPPPNTVKLHHTKTGPDSHKLEPKRQNGSDFHVC